MKERWHLVSGVTSGMGSAFLDLLHSKGGERIIAIVRDRDQVAGVRADRHIVLDFARPDAVVAAFEGFENRLNKRPSRKTMPSSCWNGRYSGAQRQPFRRTGGPTSLCRLSG